MTSRTGVPEQLRKYAKGRGVKLRELVVNPEEVIPDSDPRFFDVFVPVPPLEHEGVIHSSVEINGLTTQPVVVVHVPGMTNREDALVSVVNQTLKRELALMPDKYGQAAFTRFFSSNKAFQIATLEPEVAPSKVWFEIVPAQEDEGTYVTVTSPTSEQLALFETMQSDHRIITVHAEVSTGTTIALSAFRLVGFVNTHTEANTLVVASIPFGTGATQVTAFGPNNIGTDVITEAEAALAPFLLTWPPEFVDGARVLRLYGKALHFEVIDNEVVLIEEPVTETDQIEVKWVGQA